METLPGIEEYESPIVDWSILANYVQDELPTISGYQDMLPVSEEE